MDGFLTFAHELIWQILSNIANFFITLGQLFLGVVTSFGQYALIVLAYFPSLTLLQKVLAVILVAVLIIIILLLVYKLVLTMRKHIRHKHTQLKKEDLVDEIAMLNQQVSDLVDEKGKILAMKVSQLGLRPGEDNTTAEGDGSGTLASAMDSRFPKLTLVDQFYAEAPPREWDNTLTLPQILDGYRNFAASRMKLFYTQQTVRLFFSSLSASRIIILEGISGTGKTSLPYSVAHYLGNQAAIVSVQPSFRDRGELLGYFNEFTKRFNETEFLRSLYAANYREDPNLIVLDEMNLARIEYYFAEMLSVLEMPDPDEWMVDLVPVQWATDPKRLEMGKLRISTRLWFIGTANNDDSTFTITDKVYDRAMALDLNDRAEPFEAPDTGPISLHCDHLYNLFAQAKADYPISEKSTERIAKLDQYLQAKFKLAIGNRIYKQMKDFIPTYVACGGTESDALDYIIQRKIFKKFESLSLSYARDELGALIAFLDKLYGKTGLPMTKRYLLQLQALNM